jgi:SiaC family regulatory phosphoprotein
MENLIIEETKSSPSISLNAQTRVFEISGESYPENAAKFYAPVIEWLDIFFQGQSQKPVIVNITLHYFNSSSSKVLMDIFDLLDNAHAKGTPVTVNWRYHEENDTAIECGEEFKDDIEHLKFHMVQFTNEDL